MKKTGMALCIGLSSGFALAQTPEVELLRDQALLQTTTGTGDDRITHYVAPVVTDQVNRDEILSNWRNRDRMVQDIGFEEIDLFINLAKQLWQVIQDNEPVATIQSHFANALPKELQDPMDMTEFSDLQIRSFRYFAKNLYGVTVYDISISAVHQYGGQFNGKGAYLESVSLVPADVDVMWGYNLDLSAKHIKTTNAGTLKDPIARMALQLNFRVETVFQKHEVNHLFEFRGDRAKAVILAPGMR